MKTPSGGIKLLYHHVNLLRKHNFDAYILHINTGFRLNWFSNSVPVVYLDENLPIAPGDVVVIPEGGPQIMERFKELSLRKVVIALSYHYIFNHMKMGQNWKDFDINTVITPSKIIADFVQWSMGIKNVILFRDSIDHTLFTCVPHQKRLQIAYLGRKDTHTPLIEKILKSKDKAFYGLEFVKIENMPVHEYANIFKQSHLYLTTSPLEGRNLSILEAMACGCICVGYHGVGAREYIIDSGPAQNFVLAENMNYLELSKQLYETVRQLKNGDPRIETIRNNALQTASRFHPLKEEESLLRCWQQVLNRWQQEPLNAG